MNRAEILAAYNLPRVNQSPQYQDLVRELRTLVRNKDRAYERLINGKQADGRPTSKPT